MYGDVPIAIADGVPLHGGIDSVTVILVGHRREAAHRPEIDERQRSDGLVAQLASDADLFIAHNAVPEGATGVERNLHMPPSVIGRIAADAHVKHLALSHRMLRTLGKEDQTQIEIRKRYTGPMEFANDLDCFPVK